MELNKAHQPLLLLIQEFATMVEVRTLVKFVPSNAQCRIVTLSIAGTDGLALTAGTGFPPPLTPAHKTST